MLIAAMAASQRGNANRRRGAAALAGRRRIVNEGYNSNVRPAGLITDGAKRLKAFSAMNLMQELIMVTLISRTMTSKEMHKLYEDQRD